VGCSQPEVGLRNQVEIRVSWDVVEVVDVVDHLFHGLGFRVYTQESSKRKREREYK